MTFFYTKNDEWFLDSSIDIKQGNPLMRFDKMETYAEYSLQLMSQGPSWGGYRFGHGVFIIIILIVYRRWTISFNCCLLSLWILNLAGVIYILLLIRKIFMLRFRVWIVRSLWNGSKRCRYLTLCQLDIQGRGEKQNKPKLFSWGD